MGRELCRSWPVMAILHQAVQPRVDPLHIPDRRNKADALIAATAIVRGLVVVTRNTDGFKLTGAPLLNPMARLSVALSSTSLRMT